MILNRGWNLRPLFPGHSLQFRNAEIDTRDTGLFEKRGDKVLPSFRKTLNLTLSKGDGNNDHNKFVDKAKRSGVIRD